MTGPTRFNHGTIKWLYVRDTQVSFISQEAKEKAREIQVKADEEFAIEKVRESENGDTITPAVRVIKSEWADHEHLRFP